MENWILFRVDKVLEDDDTFFDFRFYNRDIVDKQLLYRVSLGDLQDILLSHLERDSVIYVQNSKY